MSLSVDRLVRNQLLFREVNDRIREVTDQFNIDGQVDFICECSREDCTETLPLDLDEYGSVRSSPTLFLIVPGHETLSVEHVVDVTDRVMLVEKTKHVDEVVEAHSPPEG